MTHRSSAVSTLAVAILLARAPAGVAHAGVAGSATLTSDHLFRGISQNNQEPPLQADPEYADSGFYSGTWGSNTSWLSDLTAFGVPVSKFAQAVGVER